MKNWLAFMDMNYQYKVGAYNVEREFSLVNEDAKYSAVMFSLGMIALDVPVTA